MVRVVQGDTGIAPHAVSKVNPQPLSHPARVAIRAVKDGPIAVVKEIANFAKVFGKALFVELAVFVDALLGGRLQSLAFHARDFRHGVSVQGRRVLFHIFLALLLRAQTTRVQVARNRVPQFASPRIVHASQDMTKGCSVVICGCHFFGRKLWTKCTGRSRRRVFFPHWNNASGGIPLIVRRWRLQVFVVLVFHMLINNFPQHLLIPFPHRRPQALNGGVFFDGCQTRIRHHGSYEFFEAFVAGDFPTLRILNAL
mmetsp:Transcript_19364/g.39809  ORF Transcript_19364/g.39809 Transcript_19364/m.39809 type:complete len:255 (+) Transcript_19364:147-911(+)